MLDRFQKKYIREKMDEIGSETKILAFYNKDDEVSKYALEQLEKGEYKKGKAKVYYKVIEYKEVAIKSPEIFTDYAEAETKRRANGKENKNIFMIVQCNKKGK
jgi:hypothetical protein